MYIVAIAWLYVLLLVSIMQPTVFRGIVTFIGAGLLPLALLLYLMGTPQRRRNRAQAEAQAIPPDRQAAAELTQPAVAAQQTDPIDPATGRDKAPASGARAVNPGDPAR